MALEGTNSNTPVANTGDTVPTGIVARGRAAIEGVMQRVTAHPTTRRVGRILGLTALWTLSQYVQGLASSLSQVLTTFSASALVVGAADEANQRYDFTGRAGRGLSALAEKARKAVNTLAEKAREAGPGLSALAEKAREAFNTLAEKAREAGRGLSQLAEKDREAVNTLAEKAREAGRGLSALAEKVREAYNKRTRTQMEDLDGLHGNPDISSPSSSSSSSSNPEQAKTNWLYSSIYISAAEEKHEAERAEAEKHKAKRQRMIDESIEQLNAVMDAGITEETLEQKIASIRYEAKRQRTLDEKNVDVHGKTEETFKLLNARYENDQPVLTDDLNDAPQTPDLPAEIHELRVNHEAKHQRKLDKENVDVHDKAEETFELLNARYENDQPKISVLTDALNARQARIEQDRIRNEAFLAMFNGHSDLDATELEQPTASSSSRSLSVIEAKRQHTLDEKNDPEQAEKINWLYSAIYIGAKEDHEAKRQRTLDEKNVDVHGKTEETFELLNARYEDDQPKTQQPEAPIFTAEEAALVDAMERFTFK